MSFIDEFIYFILQLDMLFLNIFSKVDLLKS